MKSIVRWLTATLILALVALGVPVCFAAGCVALKIPPSALVGMVMTTLTFGSTLYAGACLAPWLQRQEG